MAKRFDIFLSHHSVDTPWVTRLKKALEERGLTIWLGRDEIRPGDLVVNALQEGLLECRAVALVTSPESIASGWVREEYSRAVALAQDRLEPVQLIPVLLREVALPGFLANRSWVDFRDEALFDQGVDQLVWGATGKKPRDQAKGLLTPPVTGAWSELLDPPYRQLPRDPSDAELLDASYGALPFRGLQAEVEQVERWCHSGSSLALGVITAPGGHGKTRFAAEVCTRLAAHSGWAAGFLKNRYEADAMRAALGRTHAPVLIAVDDAAGRVDDIAALLQATGERVRVLLIDRQAGDWFRYSLWQQLRGAAMEAYQRATFIELPAPATGEADRQQAFDDAGRSFAAKKGLRWSPPPLRELTGSTYDSLLFIQLTALLLLTGEQSAIGADAAREQLLATLLRRERLHWMSAAKVSGLDVFRPVVDRMLSLFVLTRVESDSEAITALRSLPELANAGQERLSTLLRWLQSLYDGPELVSALSPDLLGEALVAEVLREDPAFATRLLGCSSARQSTQIMGSLIRIAATAPALALTIARTFKDLTPPLFRMAVWTAVQSESPVIPKLLVDVYEARAGSRMMRGPPDVTTVAGLPSTTTQPPGRRDEPLVAPAMRMEDLRALARSRPRKSFIEVVGPFALLPVHHADDINGIEMEYDYIGRAGVKRRWGTASASSVTSDITTTAAKLTWPEKRPALRRYLHKILQSLDGDAMLAMPCFWTSRVSQASIADRDSIKIGRKDDCDLIIREGSVSGTHASIRCTEDGRCLIMDLKSTNGTWINSSPSLRGEAALDDCDIIRFGSAGFYYFTSTGLWLAMHP